MFYINYHTMHKVHIHAAAIMQLLYDCVYVLEIIHSLKLVDNLPVHKHKQTIQLLTYVTFGLGIIEAIGTCVCLPNAW